MTARRPARGGKTLTYWASNQGTSLENDKAVLGPELAKCEKINVYWNQVMAASLVVSLPIVVAFLLLQKYLVAGLTSGSVK